MPGIDRSQSCTSLNNDVSIQKNQATKFNCLSRKLSDIQIEIRRNKFVQPSAALIEQIKLFFIRYSILIYFSNPKTLRPMSAMNTPDQSMEIYLFIIIFFCTQLSYSEYAYNAFNLNMNLQLSCHHLVPEGWQSDSIS